jgi:hypothetical protein
VPEASVALTYPVEYAGGPPDLATVTDAEGRFRFASARKPFILAASKPRVGAASAYFTPGAHAVLRLHAGARVEGVLLDEADGAPVAGALVSSQMAGGVYGHARAVTGADGRFVLDGLDPYQSALWVRPREHLDTVVRPRLAAGETTALELRLPRSVLLRGEVVDAATGAPVALAAVEAASSPQRTARLLGDGRFEIFSQRWGMSMVVRADGYPDTAFSFDPNMREQVFRMDRGVLVRFRARDESDHPVAGVRVDLIRSSSVTRWRDLVTADDGEVAVRLPTVQAPALPWIALAQHADHAFDPVEFKLGRESETAVVLRGRAAGRLSGRVVAPDGGPAAGARVDVAARQCHALEDGRFRLDAVPPGRVAVRVQAVAGAATVEADVGAGGETDLGDVLLRPGATITGHVTRPDGNRIERYTVWTSQGGGNVEPDGSFRLTGVEEGRAYELHVQAGGVGKVVPDVLAGTQGLEIRLDDYATIRGRVIVPEGEEMPLGLSVGCARADGRGPGSPAERQYFNSAVHVYVDGGFVIEGVPAGRYAVSASAEASSYARVAATVEARTGETAEVELRLVRGGTVEGTVSGPLPAGKVMVWLVSEDPEAQRLAPVRDGAFRAHPVAPGRYAAEARTFEPGFRGTRQEIAVRAGETVRCALDVVATGDLLVRAAPGTALALLDASGQAVTSCDEERNALHRLLWEAAGRPRRDPQVRSTLDAEVDRALAAADREGVWRRLALFPGEYTVAAGERRERVVVRAGETIEVDLRR